jgi:TolB-like protein
MPTSFDRRRLAVLPFSNISPEAADEYFADGMTEELISTMSKINGLKVIARTSVMGYKGGQKKINDIARELQVGTVMEGSVRKAGTKLRIMVQLIDAQTSDHLWVESYDRQLEDIFSIQREVASKVADSLTPSCSPAPLRAMPLMLKHTPSTCELCNSITKVPGPA